MRRQSVIFLLLCKVVLGLALVACGRTDTPSSTPPNTTAAIVGEGVSSLQTFVVTDDFAIGQPRVPFILFDGTSQVATAQAVTIQLFDLSQEPPLEVWQGEAIGYNDYEVPYWVVRPEIPTPGNWGLGATVTLADGSEVQTQFVIAVAANTQAPAVGTRPPASQNRTLTTEPDISKLSSGQDPVPALYQMTVAEALASGKPTVVAFSTPAFCQTAICAPVLHSVEAVYAEMGEQVNFIHLEIYKTFEPLVQADEVTEWRLTSEPWIFVLDGEGQIAAALGGPVSPQELLDELAHVLP
ncbi:MAG: thioredoxin family protein [Chloroflexi bacterium]|nr:thioredoxin family protein [Chloroflexota bacterium]MBP8057548.1 thioredoxin family protein [Chloroflexota bacterium]